MKQAYLICGLQSCGKTTLAREIVAREGGAYLSFDDFFYKVIKPECPEEFSFDAARMGSAFRWFWMELKQLCDRGVSPLVVDQVNISGPHAWKTVEWLVERYGYKLDLVEPAHPLWVSMKEALLDPNRDYNKLLDLAQQAVDTNSHTLTMRSVVFCMEHWTDFTVDDLLERT